MKSKLLFFLITITLLLTTIVVVNTSAADNLSGGQELHWQDFPLMDSAIYGLAVSGNNVWAGTTGEGVIHWQKDSGAYERFTTADGLPHNTIYDMTYDQSGNLWFGTANGVARYDGINWTSYGASDGIPHPTVRAVYVHPLNGQIIVGAATGIVIFDGTTWTELPNQPPFSVVDFVVDHSGAYWVGVGDGGVFRYDGSWVYFNNPSTGPGHDVTGIAVNPLNGDIWFSFEENGVGRVSGNTYQDYRVVDGLLSNNTSSIGVDFAGHVWVGHGGIGEQNSSLSRFAANSWTTFTADQGPFHCCINSMAFNTNGDRWFGHRTATLFENGNWKTYGTGPLWSGYLDIGDDNRLWFSQYRDHVGTLRGQRWSYYSPYDGVENYTITDVAVDDNNHAWVVLFQEYNLMDAGLNRFDGQNWHFHNKDNSNLPSNEINDMDPDGNGNIWFATPQGASKWNGGTFSTLLTTSDGLPGNDIRVIAADGNDVWFSFSPAVGIVHYDGSNVDTYTFPDDLFYNFANDMDIGPTGDLWLVAGSGDDIVVSQFTGSTWTHFQNVPDGDYYELVVDANNTPWLSSTKEGILHYNGNSWDSYGMNSGLPTSNIFEIGRNNTRRTLWFSGQTGFIQLHILTGLDNKAYMPILEGN